MSLSKVADDIARTAQLSCILEVCSYPKPGNISRFTNFKDTKYEHFLASSIAIGPVIWKAAKRGLSVELNKMSLEKLQVGKYIQNCILETKKWHSGGNTNLGIVTLLVPLAIGAAITKARNDVINVKALRKNTGRVIMSTTVQDAVHFYRTIKLLDFAGLGKIKAINSLNVLDSNVEKEIRNEEITLYQIMEKCSAWDNICKEWRTHMHITFQVGYPMLKKTYFETGDINLSIVHCYLGILAKYPDTLIARKNNYQVAEQVSQKAKVILEEGGMLSEIGKDAIRKFNIELTKDNRLNPGTTADLTASSIMVALLQGLKL